MTARARELRNHMTDAEKRLWRHLRADQFGVRVRRQVIVHQTYILDFYIPDLKLAIEVDGGQHAESKTDRARDAYLEAQGVTVLRFWNNDVLGNTEGVLIRIAEVIENLREASPLSPLRERRGEALNGAACAQDMTTRT